MLYFIPHVLLSIIQTIRHSQKRDKVKVFLILVIITFLSAIALTSMESRHFGNFIIAFMILVCWVDLNNEEHKADLLRVRLAFYSSLFIGYIAWGILKFL